MGRARGEVEVRGRFREGICQIWVHFLMEDVPVPGGGSFATASERSEHRWVWVGGERSSLGGDKDHERRKF